MKYLYLPLFVLAASLVASCDKDDDPVAEIEQNGGQTVAVEGMEIPAAKATNIFIRHDAIYNGEPIMNYCLEYDTVKMHSRWVAFRFDEVTRQQLVSRGDEPFVDDPEMQKDYPKYLIGEKGFSDAYYDLDGKSCKAGDLQPSNPKGYFDRGHICASADRLVGRTANDQTFFMTNMSPQLSVFNQKYWTAYEGYVQKRGRDAAFADILYVTKGGTIADDQIMGYVPRQNGKRVAVPKYYFMALLKCKNNTYQAMGFLMEHKDYMVASPDEVKDMVSHIVSIDSLEKFTGIDFFPKLADDIENQVEKEVDLQAWGF